MEFSERLKDQRSKKGLTQQQVANAIGVDTTTYAHYESGSRTPDIKKLQMLCGLLEIAIEDHFPLIRTLKCPPELIEDLKYTLKHVSEEFEQLKLQAESLSQSDVFHHIDRLINSISASIAPVQKIWEDTLSTPDMDLSGLLDGQTIIRVNIQSSDWIILSKSLKLRVELYDYLFLPYNH